VQDAVTSAVDLGYRVVDEYIRAGRTAAQQLGARPPSASAAAGDLQDLMTRMAQYTSDFLGVWAQFVDVAVGGGLLRAGAATNGDTAPAAPPERPHGAPDRRTSVRLALAAARPVEVTLDLAADAAGRPLVVQGLRAADPEKPRLPDVRVESDAGGVPHLTIAVPASHPSGVYSGVIVDGENSRLLGTLSVRVGDA
jgi:hypothetical protein